MTDLGARFDRWVQAGPFTARDLGIYRIVYATLLLINLPRADVTSNTPAALWSPPPGPLSLLSGPPSHTALLGLEVVLAVALGLLVIGFFTTTASLVVGLTYLLADGTVNSYGTLDHYVFYGVVPLILCWAGWGRRFSVDASRRNTRHVESVPQWPLRLLALCLGVGFATAGLPKLMGGWLDTSTQSARSFYFRYYVLDGRPAGPGGYLVNLDSRAMWEVLDWATVAVELSVLLTMIRWSWFRRVLIVLVGFHVAVLLTMHIAFSCNVVAYGAFVKWSTFLPRSRRSSRALTGLRAAPVAAAIACGGLGLASLLDAEGRLNVSMAYVLAGGLVASVIMCQAALSHEVIRERPSPTRPTGPSR